MGQFDPASDLFRVDPQFQPLIRAAGLDARTVFDDPRIFAWRNLPDRQNCTLDIDDAPPIVNAGIPGSGSVRLHIKRYAPVSTAVTPADVERDGHQLLIDAGIPTAPLVAWGKLTDGRSFTIWLDLAGYMPGDKLVASGVPFGRLLGATADLAGKLHAGGLHHRDLYLCHFMARTVDASKEPDVALIDVARVKPLPGWLTRRRWIVKDLAQLWYSTTKLGVSDVERQQWLERYAAARGDLRLAARLVGSIRRKVRAIARHDARLNAKQPTRNVSIPQ